MVHRMAPRPPTRPVRTPRKRSTPNRSWLGVGAYAGLGLACLLLAAATFLFVAAPVELIRDRLAQQLKASTGRDLLVAGGSSVSFFPRLAVSVANVSLSAPPAMGGQPTLSAETLDAELGLMSLVGGEPTITRVVLTRPTIELRVTAAGEHSWDAARAPLRARLPLEGKARAGQAPEEQAGAPRSGPMPERIGLESVRIVDGRVRYLDERLPASHEISALNLNVGLDQGSGAVAAKGSFLWRGQQVGLDSVLSPLRSLLDLEEAHLSLRLTALPMEANFAGSVRMGPSPLLGGSLSIKAASARSLFAWLGASFAGWQEGTLRLAGSVRAAEGQISLSELDAALGEATMAGAVTLKIDGARPRLSGGLQLAELDFGRLLLRPTVPAAPSPNAPPPLRSGPLGDGAPGKVPRGAPSSEGDWSDDLIDLSLLALADADLKLAVDRVAYKQFATGPGNLELAVEGRFAKVTLAAIELYGGRGQGVVTLDDTGKTPAIGLNLALEGVSALPLLKDALGFEWLEGRGALTLALAGQGASERQLVSLINGKVAINLRNGAISGADAAKILRAVEQGRFAELSAAPGDKTQFSEFAGTFIATSGVVQNQDLRLISPRLQVSGAGTVALAQRTIDYTARTRIIGGTQTPGTLVSIGNLEIPLRIAGPWSKPNLSVVGQENLVDTVKQIGKNLKSPEVQDAIKSLLGGTDGQRTKPGDLIDKLLKKQ